MILLLGDLFRLGASLFAKLSKSIVDIVFHYILVLLTKRNISVQPTNKHELKAKQAESTSEGRPEFSLKTI